MFSLNAPEHSRAPSIIGRRRFISGAAGVAAALAIDPRGLVEGAAAAGGAGPALSGPSTGPWTPRPALAYAVQAPAHLAWVWQFRHDGERERIRSVLAEHGLGIVLKTHDGREWMSEYDPSPDAVGGPADVAAHAEFFEAGGVPFHAWSVVEGLNPAREAEMAADVLSAGARSLFLDLEAHAGFWRGSEQAAMAYGEELRRRQPDAAVVTSVDARPWEIDRVPLTQFAAFSDAIAPQVYWSMFTSSGNLRKYRASGEEPGEAGVTPTFALDAAVRKLRAFDRPLHPIGDGTAADTDDWAEFIDGAFAREVEAVSVWRFGVTAEPVWALLRDRPPRPFSYVVEPGDTLSVLAERWGTDVSSIVRFNGIANADLVRIGQELRVPRGAAVPPRPRTYTVEPGDSLWSLAELWGVSIEDIARVNDIRDTGLIRIGATLRIP